MRYPSCMTFLMCSPSENMLYMHQLKLNTFKIQFHIPTVIKTLKYNILDWRTKLTYIKINLIKIRKQWNRWALDNEKKRRVLKSIKWKLHVGNFSQAEGKMRAREEIYRREVWIWYNHLIHEKWPAYCVYVCVPLWW